VSYLKQELIEARAHKSASDDQLGNVSGKLETLENTITSLSDEGKHSSRGGMSRDKRLEQITFEGENGISYFTNS
jgi:hypothetical protein